MTEAPPPPVTKEKFKLSTYISIRLKSFVMFELAKPSLKKQEIDNVQTLLTLCSDYCKDDDCFDDLVQADNERRAKAEEAKKKVKIITNS